MLKRFYVTTPTYQHHPPFLHTPLSYPAVRYSITRSSSFCRPLPFNPSPPRKLFYLRKRREENRLSLSVSFRASSASAARASYPPLSPHFGSHGLVIDGYRRTTTPDQRSSMSFPTDRRLEATVADPIPSNSINPRLITRPRGSKLIAPPRCPALLTEDPHVNRLILRPANGAEEHAPISPRHRILSTKLLTPDPYDERLKQTTWAYSLATRKFFIADLTRVSPEGE